MAQSNLIFKTGTATELPNVSVFGLGKVGLVLASSLAERGFTVAGFDTSDILVEKLKRRQFDSSEPRLSEFCLRNAERTSFSSDAAEAVSKSDISFVIVPTPSQANGSFSLDYVKSAITKIGEALRNKNSYHLISIVSTVMPGDSERELIPYLEKISGKRVGKDFGYCYNPAFIALGEVVKGFLEPDYVLIGESDERAGSTLEAALKEFVSNGAPVMRMTPTEAEITKLASNAHDTLRVTFANMLMMLCSEIPNTNVDAITGALAHRIGRKFLKGAVPYGGPCWPRDNIALAKTLDDVNLVSDLPKTVDKVNAALGTFIVRKVMEHSAPGKIGVIGLAYKPGTPMTEKAFGTKLANDLVKNGKEVLAWDPLITSSPDLDPKVKVIDFPERLLLGCENIVITNPIKEILQLDWSKFQGVLFDCWRIIDPSQRNSVKRYFPLGIGVKE